MRSLVIALLLSLTLGATARAAEVHLSVAASMTDAVKELVASFGRTAKGVEFLPNFGSSGSLAKQIVQGAPADLFISANPKWMDYLVEERRIPQELVRTFAFNSLVLIGQKRQTVTSLADAARLGRIAIGSPKSVPAGQYAVQALKEAGLYSRFESHLVMAKDVRQALMYADRGETAGAFVYKTDALLARHAKILLEVPQKFYPRVTYPIGLTEEGAKNPQAVAFFTYLKTPAAAAILEKYGFVIH